MFYLHFKQPFFLLLSSEMVLQIENLTTAVKQREEQASEYKELFSNASTELDARTEELRSLTEVNKLV